jgi:hypothetical protein
MQDIRCFTYRLTLQILILSRKNGLLLKQKDARLVKVLGGYLRNMFYDQIIYGQLYKAEPIPLWKRIICGCCCDDE